jgi:hypothetical protein
MGRGSPLTHLALTQLEAREHPERAVGDLLGCGRIWAEHVAETRAPDVFSACELIG